MRFICAHPGCENPNTWHTYTAVDGIKYSVDSCDEHLSWAQRQVQVLVLKGRRNGDKTAANTPP